jgi:cleavage and polyadenylation specificity factor subunit 1
MFDEDSGNEPKILSASFADPYLLLIRDDSSLMILSVDANGDIDELDKPVNLSQNSWQSGSLYHDTSRLNPSKEDRPILLFLANNEGHIQVSFIKVTVST